MTLQKLAEIRMVKGKEAHPDQTWDDMSNGELMSEAREELADTYNYFEKQTPLKRLLAYILLGILWKLTLK